MPYTVEVPGHGVVEVPDGVSLQQAQIEIEKAFPFTGEDIAGAMQDPSFTPTKSDYLKFEEYSKTKQVDWITTAAQAADAAIGMIGGAISEGAQGAAANPLNYIEGFAQGTRQLYGLAAQSQDPSSPLFKFKDLVAGTGSPESRYNQFLDARQFGITSARLERGEEGIVVPPEYTNPEYVQGVSMILDPTLFVPGVGEILGASKLATRAVGKGAQLTGRAVAGVAKPLERFAGAAERIAAETIGTTPEALRSVASTAGIAGALGIAPEAAAFAAIPAGIRTAREAGEALARAGENLMTQPSRIGPLEAIGAAPGANMRQRMLGVIGQYGGDAAVDASLRGLAGGIEGAAIGTGLGFLSGGEEGAAAGLGSGGVQGAAGALGARGYQKLTGAAAKEARAGDLGRFIDSQQDPTTKALFERVRDQHGVDAASGLMDLQGLVRGKFGDIEVIYRNNKDFADQFGGSARGVQVDDLGGRPAVVINADILGKSTGDGPLYTLGHELFHALEKTTQLEGGATEIKDSLVGRWVQEGDVVRKLAEGAFNDAEIDARFNQYRDKLAAGSQERADQLAQYDTIDKKAGYVASELAAEHFAGLLAGQKPDALLKGFTGITRQLLDSALTQNASRALADAAATIERTFGVKPTDSVLFPDLKQASPQVNAMLRDLLRARRKLDERITIENEGPGKVLKPQDVSNPIAAKQLVDLGVAEQMPDGSVRNLSDEEIRVREEKDTTAIRTILEGVPGARVVDGEILGRFSPQQLSAIEQSQAVSSLMKDKIRAVNAAMDAGNSIFVNYGAATRRVKNRQTGKFTSKYNSGIRLSQREVLPYSFYLSKADNPVIKAIDISKIRGALNKLTAPDGSVAKGLWDNVDGFMGDLAGYFTNLDAGEGARRSAEIFGLEKAKYLGDFVNEQEKGGRKFVRDFRLDRIGSTTPMDFRARISEDAIQKSKMRWMPAEKLGDKSVINSEEGYRIISGAKHKLYGTDGKLIGIYDTQTQAERKADATQTRLQPEVSQQQRQARDEGRQATETGGRNRAVGGQEGQGQGGAVRQAGDVNKTDGLAILDGDLQLNLPKRPTVMEIATALQDRFGEPIDWKKSSDAQNKMLRDAVAQETARAVDLHPEAKGWYDENIKLTVDVLKELDPDISKPENDFIFKILLAATSDGNKVRPQFLQSWDEYTNWKNTGKISGQFVSGDRVSNIRKNLFKVEAMIQAVGWEKVRDFLTKKGTVSEIREALVKDFGLTKQEAAKIGTSELADEVVPYAIVLGPKLGSFFNNLYGDFSSVTMDRWFMRTMGRLTGTQVDTSAFKKVRSLRATLRESISKLTSSEKEFLKISSDKIKGDNIDAAAKSISTRFAKKETRDRAAQLESEGRPFMEEVRKRSNALKKIQSPLVEAPLNGRHRRWIRQRIAEVQGELKSRGIELENADLQAVLWYLEKELYDKLNYRAKPGDSDYASAAAHLYERVVGQPSSVYAGATGRIRAVGGGGSDVAMGATNPAEARAAVGEQRYMPAGAETAPKHYESVDSFREHWNALGVRNMTDIRAKGTPYEHIRPSEIEVDKASRNKGLGTAFMEDLVAFADLTGKQIRINPSDELGATSKSRLEKFYKQFGFVENKPGKNKDYAISERFYRQPSSGERFMPASDTDYLSAVQKGDTKAAQQMVDEAAKKAGAINNARPLYHGGNKTKTSFASGATRSGMGLAYLTDNKQVAWKYALGGGINDEMSLPDYRRQQLKKLPSREPTVQKLYVIGNVADFSSYSERPNAPQLIEMFGEKRMSRILEEYSSQYRDELDRGESVESTLQNALDEGGFVQEDTNATAAVPELQFIASSGLLSEYLKNVKKDVIAYNDDEAGGKTYVVFDPTKIKSADPITKDDAGNVIPLSQRFKATSEDIRFMPDYSGEHKAPQRDYGAPLNNLKGVYPDDVYGPNAAQYYGHSSGDATDKAAARIIQATKGKPDAPVKVFRAIPKSIQSNEINPGDWITTIKSYAVNHGEGPLGGDYKILEKTVPAGDLYTNGDSIFEFGYDPKFMPSPDSAMPGAYSFPGGYRALPGKAKGSLRLYGPAGSLIGIASSLDEAQRILRRKNK
jgi:GNAT superfamily N-acetyltransferase